MTGRIKTGHSHMKNPTWNLKTMTTPMTCPLHGQPVTLLYGGCQHTQMREPTNNSVPNDMGTQMGNPTKWEPPWTQAETNQPLHHTEAQPIQYRINNINETPTLPDPNTDSYYNKWGDNMQPEKQPNTVHLALQNFGDWPRWNNKKNQTIWHYLNEKTSISSSPQKTMWPGTRSHQHNDYQNEHEGGGKWSIWPSGHQTQQKRLQC